MSSREQYEADQQHEWERVAGVQLGRCERAEALVARYRAALEQIARHWSSTRSCGSGCFSCIAAAALEEK